ncbi:uroporphyrinogen decarboxylase [Caldiplasma sukawensis]
MDYASTRHKKCDSISKNNKKVKTLIKENPFIQALNKKHHDSVPVWFMRQAGRYMSEYREVRKKHSIIEICHDPELSSYISYRAKEILGVDASIIFSDIMIPVENLGYSISYVENIGPVPKKERERKEMYFSHAAEACFQFKTKHPEEPLIGFSGGPLTIASYIIAEGPDKNLEKTKMKFFEDEEYFDNLMDDITSVLIHDVKKQCDAGCDAIQIFDSWAGYLDPYSFEYINKWNKKIVNAIREKNKKSIYFSTQTAGMIDQLKKIGADFLSIDWRCDISYVAEQTDSGIQGNLDPTILLSDGNKYYERTKNIIKSMREKDDFIFNLGHGVLPGTKEHKLKDIVSICRGYI